VVNEDDRLFEKTANFFCPSAKKEETSFSTVVTDETKENSAPVTPEKVNNPFIGIQIPKFQF